MTPRILPLIIPALVTLQPLLAQSLDKAQVTIPYAELKALIDRSTPPPKPAALKPALLSARLRLSFEDNHPVIDATFRATCFGNDTALVPLITGAISLDTQDPQDAIIVATNDTLNLTVNQPGTRTLKLRFLPIINSGQFSFTLPPCPSAILETGTLAADRSMIITSNDQEETLASNQTRPLSHAGSTTSFRLLDTEATREALRPPEPSTWSWQHQALVIPSDGGLIYQIIARASANNGSGLSAELPLPADAGDITITGDDLTTQTRNRGENRAQSVTLNWKTRGILDRRVEIHYRMPLRPLDRTWHLEAPGDQTTLTRFIIAASPLLAYAAKDLSDPLTPQGLPPQLADALKGIPCRILESSHAADLSVTPIPVAATAEGVANDATWSLKIEPDGAMLASGTITVDHKGMLDFPFDTPDGMRLLSCELDGKPVSPVDLGNGNLKVPLPPRAGNSKVSLSFTGTTTALDPVEGTLSLALPKVPLFVHALSWTLDLPTGYQAETQGNLTRVRAESNHNPSRITLRKNLCRDERPNIHVFYQRTETNR